MSQFLLVTVPPDLFSRDVLLAFLAVIGGLLTFLQWRSRQQVTKLGIRLANANQDRETAQSTAVNQASQLTLMGGLLEQVSKQTDLTQKSFELARTQEERWQAIAKLQTEAVEKVDSRVVGFQEFSAQQHNDTRLLAREEHKMTRKKFIEGTDRVVNRIDALINEVTALRNDVNNGSIDRRLASVESALAVIRAQLQPEVPK